MVYELPHEFPNDLRLYIQKLQNIRKISNLGGDRAQWPVSFQEIKVWQYQSKTGIAKVGVKCLSHCRILLDFSDLFQIFCLWLGFLKISNYKIFAIFAVFLQFYKTSNKTTLTNGLEYLYFTILKSLPNKAIFQPFGSF